MKSTYNWDIFGHWGRFWFEPVSSSPQQPSNCIETPPHGNALAASQNPNIAEESLEWARTPHYFLKKCRCLGFNVYKKLKIMFC